MNKPIPMVVFADCSGEAEATEAGQGHKPQALKLKVAAIASVLFAGAMGVGIPILGKAIPCLNPVQCHSIIIGISLGVSGSPDTIRPLVAALAFYQFFEGIGLGGYIAQANFKSRATAVMALFFSLTTPIRVAIGIGISNIYTENSLTSLVVEGVLNAASAGILIYMSLVDMLAAELMNSKLQSNLRLLAGANLSVLLGAGCISLLAIWS
ncbi:hypothetical protein L3X38_016595 [Prunus dulcis]|uniref:Uncharacterized protein n=1 Tax=Prunus dulcis TaxID=3755 RepID=A0AAD4W790_PRUDU|nr:hypothetical protein L3X38_016595 [Prunus dulcis]